LLQNLVLRKARLEHNGFVAVNEHAIFHVPARRAREGNSLEVATFNDALRIATHEIVGKNPHVAGGHHEVGLMLLDQRVDLLLGPLLAIRR
jgi:hypothetical protein